jgi:hypothetical protein
LIDIDRFWLFFVVFRRFDVFFAVFACVCRFLLSFVGFDAFLSFCTIVLRCRGVLFFVFVVRYFAAVPRSEVRMGGEGKMPRLVAVSFLYRFSLF